MKDNPQEKNKKSAERLTQRHWHEMNRKQRRETIRKIQSEDLSLEQGVVTAKRSQVVISSAIAEHGSNSKQNTRTETKRLGMGTPPVGKQFSYILWELSMPAINH